GDDGPPSGGGAGFAGRCRGGGNVSRRPTTNARRGRTRRNFERTERAEALGQTNRRCREGAKIASLSNLHDASSGKSARVSQFAESELKTGVSGPIFLSCTSRRIVT